MATGSLLSGADTSPLSNATFEDRRRSDEFYRQLALLQQQYQQALNAQSATTRALDRTIEGTGPSVAGTQLQQGLGQTASAINANASGATGQNAGMASYGAIQALAAAQAKKQQDAALLRAAEVDAAIKAKAGILNNEQAATGNMASIFGGGAVNLSGQASGLANPLVEANEDEVKQRRALASNALGGLSSALTVGGTGRAGK